MWEIWCDLDGWDSVLTFHNPTSLQSYQEGSVTLLVNGNNHIVYLKSFMMNGYCCAVSLPSLRCSLSCREETLFRSRWRNKAIPTSSKWRWWVVVLLLLLLSCWLVCCFYRIVGLFAVFTELLACCCFYQLNEVHGLFFLKEITDLFLNHECSGAMEASLLAEVADGSSNVREVWKINFKAVHCWFFLYISKVEIQTTTSHLINHNVSWDSLVNLWFYAYFNV